MSDIFVPCSFVLQRLLSCTPDWGKGDYPTPALGADRQHRVCGACLRDCRRGIIWRYPLAPGGRERGNHPTPIPHMHKAYLKLAAMRQKQLRGALP